MIYELFDVGITSIHKLCILRILRILLKFPITIINL